MLVLIITAFTPASAAPASFTQLAGTFQGEVFNGSDLDPVITIFSLDEYGRLSGSYTVDEELGAYSGILSNIIFDDERSLSMEWTDKFGEGFAIMEFNRDFTAFSGAWTDKNSDNSQPWNGKKLATDLPAPNDQ